MKPERTEHPLRLLLVEDNPDDADLLLMRIQREGFILEAERVEEESGFLRALERPPDLILADWSLPRFSGLRALELLNRHQLDIPFIIVSGSIGEEAAVEAMRLGADDYLLKDRLARLGQSIRRALEEKRLRDEQRRAAAALRESEIFSRDILNSLLSNVAVLDDHGQILMVNESWRAFSSQNGGESPGAYVGANYLEVCERAVREADDAYAASAYRGISAILEGSPEDFSLEYPCPSPDQPRWFLMRVSPLRSRRGGAVVSHFDITQRKLSELALAESEEKYRLLLENSGLGVGYFDPEGNALMFNQQALKYLDGKAEDFIGRNITELYPGPAGKKYLRRIQRAAATDELKTYEDWVALPGGQRWFRSNYARILDGEGNVAGVQIISDDITRIKEAEISLRLSEEKFRRYFENAPDAIFVADGRGIYIDVNPAGCRMTGYSRQEIIGKPITALISSESRDAAAQHFQRVLETGVSTGDLRYRTKSGETRWWTVNAVKIHADLYLGFVSDVTERKLAEAEIQASLAEKTVLLREIHHRVKNNLEVILSLADLQSRRLEDPLARESLLLLQERIRTIALVHDSIYRSPELAHIQAQSYLRKLTDSLFLAFGFPGVELLLDAEDIYLDIDRAIPCGLIVTELVTNALKYAFPESGAGSDSPEPAPAKQIRIALQQTDGQIRLQVSDNGVGLPPEFDWQNTRTFGLRLVNRLVDQIHARLEIHSDHGAQITVTFPA